jgi:hypothetical protein
MDAAYLPVHQSQLPQPVPPVSADWDPWYRRRSGASMLPAPCFSPQASLYTGCPEAARGGAVRLVAVLVVLSSPWCDARGEDPEASLKEEKI